jgi:acetyl-CoA C-acetyltransferase
MIPFDPRAPVLVGAGQITARPGEAPEPSALGLMTHAAQRAIADAGAGAGDALLRRLHSIAAVESVTLPLPDPAALVAGALRSEPRETVLAVTGGNSPIALLADLAQRIQAGQLDVALIVGAEAFTPLMAAMREGRALDQPAQPDGAEPTRTVGVARDATNDAEAGAGLIAPVAVYPFLESAVRGAAGRDRESHQRWLGELWARVGEPARENPYAWTREVPPAETISTPAAGNRAVTIPYTKLLNANIQVDQGAALLLCSAQAARDAGVPAERWVYVAATAGASDHWFFSERDVLHRSPAIAACGRSVLSHAGIGIDDVAHLDLYSCFPSAVQIAGTELGIDLASDTRGPSATGGLTFAGGPGSNYVTHSLATLVERIRRQPEQHALATALGWYVTKHAVALLAGRPPARSFAHHEAQSEVDALPRRTVAQDAGGAKVPVEAYTAMYARDGSLSVAMASGLLPDGRRALAKADDPGTLAHVARHDILGHTISLRDDGRFELVDGAP